MKKRKNIYEHFKSRMMSADQGFGEAEHKLLGAKRDVQAAKEELAAAETKLAVAKEELAEVETKLAKTQKKWIEAKEESLKTHYSWMMDLAKRKVDTAQKQVNTAQEQVNTAQEAVGHYQAKVFSLEKKVSSLEKEVQPNEQILGKFSEEGWEPRPPSANWEEKLPFFNSRDDILGVIKNYVSGVKAPERSPERRSVLSYTDIHAKGFAICSTVGIMGMGKTALMRMIHQNPSLVGAKKAIFVNFNSGDGVLPDPIISRSTPKESLASALLYSSAKEPHKEGFEEFCLSVNCPRRAVQLIRSNLKMDDSDMLVIAIDELGKMGNEVIEPQKSTFLQAGTLRSAMTLMDTTNASKKGGSISFIFTALVEEDVKAWRGNTGRSIYPDAILRPLSWEKTRTTLDQMFEHDTASLNLLKNGKIIQLLQQCYGHPRSVFDVVVKTIRQISAGGTRDPTETQIYSEFQSAFLGLSLPALDFDIVSRSLAARWEIDKDAFLRLKKDGILCEHEHGNWIVLPLALLEWAKQKSASKVHAGHEKIEIERALSHHIQCVFNHDAMVGLHREKHAEYVMMHVEAAIRIAQFEVGPDKISLADLFQGAIMQTKFFEQQKHRFFNVFPPNAVIPSHGLVHEVDQFEGTQDDVLQKLSDGFIVHSKYHNERAVEYLSPLWDVKTKKMIILGVQVKHTPKGKGFEKIAEPIEPRLRSIFGEEFEIIPLIYTTKTAAKLSSFPESGICFNRQGLSEYTQGFGNLKLVASDKIF